MTEKCALIVNTRGRFSTTARCLERLIAQTPPPYDLIVVIGGAPEKLKQQWVSRFGGQAKFIFHPTFLNQAQARNIGLREAKTRLSLLVDRFLFRSRQVASLLAGIPKGVLRKYKAHRISYFAWPASTRHTPGGSAPKDGIAYCGVSTQEPEVIGVFQGKEEVAQGSMKQFKP